MVSDKLTVPRVPIRQPDDGAGCRAGRKLLDLCDDTKA